MGLVVHCKDDLGVGEIIPLCGDSTECICPCVGCTEAREAVRECPKFKRLHQLVKTLYHANSGILEGFRVWKAIKKEFGV